MTPASERLRDLDEAMTPGPWEIAEAPPYDRSVTHDGYEFPFPLYQVAALRNALPELIAVVEAAEEIKRREARSDYQGIYSAPAEFVDLLRDPLRALQSKLEASA